MPGLSPAQTQSDTVTGTCSWMARNGVQSVVNSVIVFFSMTSRETKQQSAPASVHKNFRYMSTEEKDQHIQRLTLDKRAVKAWMAHLNNKLACQTEEKGVLVDDSMEEDFIHIAADHQMQILESYPEESFQHLFWKQELQTTSTSSKGRCWHPTMIKWDLYLRH